MPMLMTPGPTDLPPGVQEAMQRPILNPDVQPDFRVFYRRVEEKLRALYGTADDVVVLSGEGILGLETSVASVTAPGDRVLCLANGRYGAGFARLVDLYDGVPVLHEAPWNTGFDLGAIEDRIANEEFTAATMVHCETPTGLINDLEPIVEMLQDAGIITIVDAVSSLGGARVPADRIDLCIAASQKCLSAPPGLTTLTVSDRAWAKISETPQRARYASLQPWRSWFEDKWFPYTMPISTLYALDAALDRVLDDGVERVIERHASVAARCRERGRELGLDTYPVTDAVCSPTVTAFDLGTGAQQTQARLADEHNIVIATSLGEFDDRLLRIGHMGYNADPDRVDQTMDALETVIQST